MYCNGKGVVNVGYINEEGDLKLKEYQVELIVKGEGCVYPYIVSAMKEEWAEQDAIQMLLRDFPIFNGKEISTYKIICVNKGDVIEDTIEIIKNIYKKYPSGGALHIVLDDYNIDDENILWCLQHSVNNEEFCTKEDRKMFEQCAINLIKIDECRRENVIKKALSFMMPKRIIKSEKYKGLDNKWHENYRCPSCDRYVVKNKNACSNCGQLLKWQ